VGADQDRSRPGCATRMRTTISSRGDVVEYAHLKFSRASPAQPYLGGPAEFVTPLVPEQGREPGQGRLEVLHHDADVELILGPQSHLSPRSGSHCGPRQRKLYSHM